MLRLKKKKKSIDIPLSSAAVAIIMRWWDMDILWLTLNILQNNLLKTYMSCGRKSLYASCVPLDSCNRVKGTIIIPIQSLLHNGHIKPLLRN